MLHGGENFSARKLLPGRGNERRLSVVLAHERNGVFKLFLARDVGMREDYAVCRFYLVVEELAEILHIHFALCGVDDCRIGVYGAILKVGAVNCANDVGELAHARGFNQNPIGIVLLAHLLQRLGKIAHERTADTARVELVNLYARVGEKASVYADIAEFVLNEDEFFAGVSFLYQLFDERGFARAEKTGKNIYLCHCKSLP